jgi:uncharacterized protein (TIGR01777 family)
MRIVVSGASGFLGTKLVARLRESGHDVLRLVRRAPSGAGEVRWDPTLGTVDPQALVTADAVVNLSGANIGDKRWTPAYKRELIESRISATRTLVGAIAALPAGERPGALLQMSGVDWYGDPGENPVDETTSPAGGGFLTEMAQAWEEAAAPAADAGVRLVLMRTGLPMGTEGGYLKPLLLPFKLGVGGQLGNGRAWIPWISVPDWLAAVEFLLVHDDIAGPVNVVGPAPVRSREFAKALGRQLHRPALFPVPKVAMAVVAGNQFAGEILVSRKVLPAVLRDRDFRFAHATIDDALAVALRR